MKNFFELFKYYVANLPDFCEKIEPICHKNSVTANEGLVLLSIFENQRIHEFCDKSVKDELMKKLLLNENNQLTSKGSIVAKSLQSNIERLKF